MNKVKDKSDAEEAQYKLFQDFVAPDFMNTVQKVVDIGRKADPMKWSVQDVICKLLEEAGEFSEAIQNKVGKIHKNLEPDADFDEAADAIICVIDGLSQANLDVPRDYLVYKLQQSIIKKSKKWEAKIDLYTAKDDIYGN